ncbi:MAG: type II toxin-antitoxin system RelE/ParE family toxin [Tannerella sp.]|jgi:plasmid stabilization system protein ParE|nr:type II toxin-antitoxin system RelE/ParE family toxin [Tannerella sp.]
MKPYFVKIHPAAIKDLDALYCHIADVYMAPFTARKYRDSLMEVILALSRYGPMLAPSQNERLIALYGPGVRTTTYKKMSIVYLVADDTVYVLRILPGQQIH